MNHREPPQLPVDSCKALHFLALLLLPALAPTHTHALGRVGEADSSLYLLAIGARNAATAQDRRVHLQLSSAFPETLDSHRGSLLCLIAANLVQNAIAASASGETVMVDLTRTAQTITLTVADSGAGIPPTARARLFEPGQSGRPGGTGLGLAISRLLALQIGADLALVHTGAEGTRFALTLPLT